MRKPTPMLDERFRPGDRKTLAALMRWPNHTGLYANPELYAKWGELLARFDGYSVGASSEIGRAARDHGIAFLHELVALYLEECADV
jgi:hypothetical protein